MPQIEYKPGDKIEISKSDSKPSLDAIIETMEHFGGGLQGSLHGAFSKAYVTLACRRGSLSFVFKNVFTAERVYELHKEMKKAKIPVVDSMRVIDSKIVAMTDLRQKGYVFFGKAMYNAMNDEENQNPINSEKKKRAKTYLDSIPQIFFDNFMNSTQDLDPLNQTLHKYAQKAASKSIYLPCDEWFEIAVHESGETRTLLLDIDMAYIVTDMTEQRREQVSLDNSKYIERTSGGIKRMREWILKNRPQSVPTS